MKDKEYNKYARLDIVKCDTPEKLEIIKQVLNGDSKEMKDKFKDAKGLDKAYMSLAKHYDERKENAIRQVKDGAFVDLLNQEQAELQKAIKEKQIEEIAQAIESANAYMDCDEITLAEHLYEQGYRKIENSVVLSREELAQKIYDDIFAILKIKLWLYGDDAMTKNLNGLTKQKILDFTKKWGIKDNHLNEKDYSHIDHLQAHDKQIKEQERKETAEKILNELYVQFSADYLVGLRNEYKDWKYANLIKRYAKSVGVEIKE